MNFEKGEWVSSDDLITKVIGVYPINYELFDSEVRDGVSKVGDFKCNYFLLRDLCDFSGKLVSSKPYVKYGGYYLECLDDDDLLLIENVKQKKPKKFEEWENKEIDPKSKICELSFSFEVAPGEGSTILKRFKKVCKQLPNLFSFSDLVSISKQSGIEMSSCVDCVDCVGGFDNQISFLMKFNLDDIKEGVIYFHKVYAFDYTDAQEDADLLSNFFNFEMLYLSFVLFLNRYLSENTDENALKFNAELKKAVLALTQSENNQFDNELAKQFFDFVPKKLFAKEEAFRLFREYIEMNKQAYNLDSLCQTLDEKRDWSVEIYNLSYDWAK